MFDIILKHKIYESCINVFFDNLMKNFPVKQFVPKIGDKFSVITDLETGDTFYNCTIIDKTDLHYYDDLVEHYEDVELDINEVAFGVRYQSYVDEDGEGEDHGFGDYGETNFTLYELNTIRFEK